MTIRRGLGALLLVLVSLLAPPAAAQGVLIPDARLRVFSDASVILPGAKLHTYVAGTTSTPLTTYSAVDLAVGHENANPVIASAGGLFGPIYLTPGVAYKLVLTDAADGAVWTQDNVSGGVSGATITGLVWANLKLDFHAVGDGVADDTAALQNAYASSKLTGRVLFIPAGIYKFTSTLVWDGSVSIYGAGRTDATVVSAPKGGTILYKAGNIVGIQINGGGENAEYANWVLDNKPGLGDVSDGIQVNVAASQGLAMRNLIVRNQGGNGILLLSASEDLFQNIFCGINGGAGMKFAPTGSLFVTSNTFTGLSLRGNTGHGLDIAGGGLGTFGNFFVGVVSQNNTGYGIRSNATTANEITAYVEANTGGDVLFDVASVAQFIVLLNSSIANPAVVDNGVGNGVFDFSLGRFGLPSISSTIPGTNAPGRDFSVSASRAGVGAAGQKGGNFVAGGGDARGTAGAADGGSASLAGGGGINGGKVGLVMLQSSGGSIAVGGSTVPGVSVAMDFQSTTQVPLLPRLTTTQRDALTAVDGMVIYNTSLATMQYRKAGAWVSF